MSATAIGTATSAFGERKGIDAIRGSILAAAVFLATLLQVLVGGSTPARAEWSMTLVFHDCGSLGSTFTIPGNSDSDAYNLASWGYVCQRYTGLFHFEKDDGSVSAVSNGAGCDKNNPSVICRIKVYKYCPSGTYTARGWLNNCYKPASDCSECNGGSADRGGVNTGPATAHPIEFISGRKIGQYVDWTSGGAHPLQFKRFYTSTSDNFYGAPRYAMLGAGGWRTSFDSRVAFFSWNGGAVPDPVNAGDGDYLYIAMPNGGELKFRKNSVGWEYRKMDPTGSVNVRTDSDVSATVSATGVVLRMPDNSRYEYDLLGPLGGGLRRIVYPDNYSQQLSYNALGQVTQVADSFGRYMNFEYTSVGGLVYNSDQQSALSRLTTSSGETINFTYNSFPAQTPFVGGTLSGSYGTLLESLIYDDLTPATLADNPRLSFTYQGGHYSAYLLTGIYDARAVRQLAVTYDANDRATSSELAGGAERVTVSYDDVNSKVTVTNALGRQTVYTLVPAQGGSVRVIANVEGVATSNVLASNEAVTLDAKGLPAQRADAEGRLTTWLRDAVGRPTSLTSGAGTPQAVTRTTNWNATRKLPDLVTEPGRKTSYVYNADGTVASMTEEDTTTTTVPYVTTGQLRTTTYTYQSFTPPPPVGQVTLPNLPMPLLASVDGPLAGISDTTRYTYDVNGNLKTVTNEIGHVTDILAVNSAGRPTQIRDANGVVTVLAYTPRGWLESVTVNPGAAQAVTALTCDVSGNITQITRPDGSWLKYSWNDPGYLSKVTNTLNETIEYTYNANGDVTSTTTKSPTAAITRQMTMVYDELGRLMQSVGAATQTSTYTYDRTDLQVQMKDPRNNLHGSAYDSLQRLIRTTDPEGAQVNLTRNGQDDVVGYADPRSIVTSYVRNGFGEVIRESSPDFGTTVYVRDARGLVTQVTDPRARITNKTYDAAGRLLTEVYPAATAENVTYTYDNIVSGNFGKGRLTGMTHQGGSIAFVYDAFGRIIKDTRVIASKTYVVQYAYNAAGRVSQIIYPSGRVVQVARNAEGQATAVTTKQTATAAVVNIATGISYQPMSNLLTTLTHGNGLVTTATYDLDERLTSLRVTNGATLVNGYAYAYADGMNLTGITDQLAAANSNTLAYSPANRLAVANGPWGNSSYLYDLVGNRTSEVTTLGATTTTRTSTYPATSNRLSNVAQTGSTTAFRSFTYDAAGNTLTDARLGMTAPLAYTYNARNRMSALSGGSPARTATYIYNALEQMISRQTNAAGAPTTIVHYIYDLDGHLIAEANGSLKTTTVGYLREYIWLPANDNNNDTIAEELVAANDNHVPDLPLAVIDVAATPTISQVHTDHLGRPVRMTSATKATTWNTIWTPWGAAHATTGTATNNLRFPGQYFLIETGLAYNWHRTYDPATGRYTQPDPLRFVDGPSVYAYVGNSPFIVTDRDGRDAGVFAAAGGAALADGPLPFGDAVAIGIIAAYGAKKAYDWCTAKVDEAQCEANYEIDLDTCRAVSRRRGKAAAARCFASAAERYSSCLSGRQVGPLDVWNN